MNKLQKKFIDKVRPQMMKEFGFNNPMAVPVIEKVSVNVGLSRAESDPSFKKEAISDLKMITGQSPVAAKAKKAISGFQIREGQEVGTAVTLRNRRMWDFIYKLISATIPRIKDFQGIERKSFDRQGNLSIGIKEQLIFPEISPDDVSTIFGLQVNIVTTAKNREEGMKMFKLLGFPIKDEE